MDALKLLKQYHQKVKELFHAMTHTADQTKRKALFDEIDAQLQSYSHSEETVFYPVIEEHSELKEMVDDVRAQHEEVRNRLDELEDLGSDNHDFGSRLQLLMDAVEQHIEEEETDMFPRVREIFAEDELEKLGQRLESAKDVARTRG